MVASPHLIGIGSGIVAAVLFASLATNTMLAAFLFYVTPLPLLLARLGWGRASGQLAFLTATALVAIIISLKTAMFYGVTIGLPALLLGHLALLHRQLTPEDAEGRPLPNMPPVVQWYPPGHIIAWTAVIAGALVTCGLLLLTVDADSYHRGVRKVFEESILPQIQSSGVPIDTLRAERYISLVSRVLLPAVAAVVWMFVMLFNLWLAAKTTSISGLLARPWPRFANLEFPPIMTVGFVASVGIALLPGMPGIVATAFVGAFGFAYLLLGLVILHQVVGDSQFKPLYLAGLYLGILLIDWGAVAVAVIGLAEPLLELRQRALKRSAPPPGRGKPDL
jgi:Predicted membrane protein (DUF2232)